LEPSWPFLVLSDSCLSVSVMLKIHVTGSTVNR